MAVAATAIVLARSAEDDRRDPSLHPYRGSTQIQHIVRLLRPEFAQIVVCAREPALYAFLGTQLIRDRAVLPGPMPAMAAAMSAADHERSFVVTCDRPSLDFCLIQTLLDAAKTHEGALPCVNGVQDPCYAVYRWSMLDAFEHSLAAGSSDFDAVLRQRDIHEEPVAAWPGQKAAP